MSAWVTKRIDQLGRVVTGKTPSSERLDEFGDEYPFITPSDIPSTQRSIQVERHLSERGMEAHRRIKLPAKSTCVVCIGATVGKTCMTESDSISNQQINSIIPTKGESDPDFVYYIATTLRDSLVAFAGGAATPIINKSTFSSLKLLVPDYAAQQKIAAVLSAYDELIENNRRRIALLEKLAEEIYREWFVRLRFPGHEKVKVVKGMPEGWKDQPASEVLHVMGGGTPKTEVPAYWDGDIPFFTPKDSHVGFYVLDTEKKLTVSGLESCSSQLFPVETMFITARGTVGELCLAHQPMAMNQSCYALAPKNAQSVFFHFLAMKTAIAYIKGISKSGVFDNIVIDTFKQVPIRMPGEGLVNQFNKIAEPIFRQVGALLKMNVQLRQTRDLLLPRLISGKLPVEELDIQFPQGLPETESVNA